MAIKLELKTNVDPPGTYGGKYYPYGKIKDDTGTGDGTPVNTEVYGDQHQFFAKMAAEAAITFNGNPDNFTDGFQYFQAFNTLVNKPWTGSGIVFTNSGDNVWANKGAGHGKAHYRVQGMTCVLSGVVTNTSLSSPATSDILTLPVGARPLIDRYVMVWNTSPTAEMIMLKIATNGKITSTTGSDGDIYLDGISFNLDTDAY